jgi:hypothetical protein
VFNSPFKFKGVAPLLGSLGSSSSGAASAAVQSPFNSTADPADEIAKWAEQQQRWASGFAEFSGKVGQYVTMLKKRLAALEAKEAMRIDGRAKMEEVENALVLEAEARAAIAEEVRPCAPSHTPHPPTPHPHPCHCPPLAQRLLKVAEEATTLLTVEKQARKFAEERARASRERAREEALRATKVR